MECPLNGMRIEVNRIDGRGKNGRREKQRVFLPPFSLFRRDPKGKNAGKIGCAIATTRIMHSVFPPVDV